MISIPVLDVNDSQIEVELSEQTFFLRMSWNSEGEFWVMSLEDYAHNLLVAGARVTANGELLGMFRQYGVPPGTLWCVLMDDTRDDVMRTDFADDSAFLVYLEPGENVEV
jgi:hypothetical protein